MLATCNRVEIYADVDALPRRRRGRSRACSREHAGVDPEELLPHLYVHYDDGAVAHLFHVASGLDSMVVGESQILGQIREALRVGQEQGTVGPALNVLFQQALRVGKRAHAETDIDRPALAGHRRAGPRHRPQSATSPASASSSSGPARWLASPPRPLPPGPAPSSSSPTARAATPTGWPTEYGARCRRR